MTWQLDVLENPGQYLERKLQAALEDLWPFFFSQYELGDPRNIKNVSNWFPDIVSLTKSSIMIAEVKRPGASRPKGLVQLLEYVMLFHEVWPDIPVRPILFGHWKQEDLVHIVESEDYILGMIQVQRLGQLIHQSASFLMDTYGEELQQILDFDWSRLPLEIQSQLNPDLLLWFLKCPIELDCHEVARMLVVDLSILEPQVRPRVEEAV